MAGSPSTASELSGAAEPRLRGRATVGGEALPLVAGCGSRASLLVAFEGGPPASGARLEAVEVEAGGRPVALGPARFEAERSPGWDGRLVFEGTVPDCPALVYEGRLADLRGAFQNLPLVLSQREGVRPEFAAFVSRLVYDLAVYRRFFDDLDRALEGEPAPVAEAARAAACEREGRAVMAFLADRDRELEALVAGFGKEEHERHGFYLRRMAWHHILASEIHRRTNLKPRGYAGDAEMMRLIYENGWTGTTTFGRVLHKYAVELQGAEAVRSRRRLVPRVLRETAARLAREGEPFRFLSLASGPAWELQDVFLAPADAARHEVVLLDQDPHALEAARQLLARLEAERGIRPRVRYVTDSVRTMLRTRDLAARLGGGFHFVYSMGLFDYLTPPVARAVLAQAWDLLLPGGTLLVGNYHVDHPSRTYMEYWLDWPLYCRTEEGFRELALGLPGAALSITYDETRAQMFLRADRRG